MFSNCSGILFDVVGANEPWYIIISSPKCLQTSMAVYIKCLKDYTNKLKIKLYKKRLISEQRSSSFDILCIFCGILASEEKKQ